MSQPSNDTFEQRGGGYGGGVVHVFKSVLSASAARNSAKRPEIQTDVYLMCNGIICEGGLITSVLLGRPPEWNKLIVSQTSLFPRAAQLRAPTKLHYTGKLLRGSLALRLIARL